MTVSAWLKEEPFHLTLSSGFFGFFAHAGVMKALTEQGHFPTSVSGSSAGALVASLWASGLSTSDIEQVLFDLKRQHFWDPISPFGLLRGKKFMSLLEDIMPVKTFAECRSQLSVSAFDIFGLRTRVFNTGDLIPAVYASCAVPGLFQPAWIEGKPYCDGGVADRPGLLGAPKEGRVLYHHLLSRRLSHHKKPLKSVLPQRNNMRVFAIPTLPPVNPFRLHAGVDAYQIAYEQTLQKLEESAMSY